MQEQEDETDEDMRKNIRKGRMKSWRRKDMKGRIWKEELEEENEEYETRGKNRGKGRRKRSRRRRMNKKKT